MATRTDAEANQANTATPDAPYAIVAGLYVAALLAPPAVLALSGVTTDAGALYVGFLGTVAGATAAAGWGAFRTPGLPVSVGRRSAFRLLPAVPVAWVVAVFGVAAAIGDPTGGAVLLSMLATLGGLFLGLVLLTMSRTRYATAVLTDADEFAQWEARWPARWRRFALVGMVVAGVLVVGGIVWRFLFGSEWNWAGYLYLLVFLWTPFAGAANPRTFRVTDAGLVVERPLQRRLVSWATVAGYTLTDDALLIRRTMWWRPSYRCDRADIENVDAVVAALDGVMGSQV